MGPSQATSLPERVREIFQSDGVLHAAIGRGFVNYRALARSLIAAYHLPGSEDAVLSAIRRLKRSPLFDPFRSARAVISRSHLNVRSRVCQLVAPKTEDIYKRLPQVFGLIDFSRGEMLYFTWGDVGMKILIDDSNLARVQSLFSPRATKTLRHLSAITVVEPEDSLSTPGILALLSETLSLQGINIVDAVFGYPEFTFFVQEPDTLKAYQALEGLIATSGAREPAKDARRATSQARATASIVG